MDLSDAERFEEGDGNVTVCLGGLGQWYLEDKEDSFSLLHYVLE